MKLNKELNRISYILMNTMLKSKAVDFMHSMSCAEIQERVTVIKTDTVYKYMKKLEKFGFVERGAKVDRAYGYILTQEGISLLPEIKEEKEEC